MTHGVGLLPFLLIAPLGVSGQARPLPGYCPPPSPTSEIFARAEPIPKACGVGTLQPGGGDVYLLMEGLFGHNPGGAAQVAKDSGANISGRLTKTIVKDVLAARRANWFYFDWTHTSRAVECSRYLAKNGYRIHLIGYSKGSESGIDFARRLEGLKIPIEEFISIDPVGTSYTVPSNVREFVQVQGTNDLFYVFRPTATYRVSPGTRGRIVRFSGGHREAPEVAARLLRESVAYRPVYLSYPAASVVEPTATRQPSRAKGVSSAELSQKLAASKSSSDQPRRVSKSLSEAEQLQKQIEALDASNPDDQIKRAFLKARLEILKKK